MANGTMNIAHSRDVDKAIREIASHAKLRSVRESYLSLFGILKQQI